jgi:hypothetical protein
MRPSISASFACALARTSEHFEPGSRQSASSSPISSSVKPSPFAWRMNRSRATASGP